MRSKLTLLTATGLCFILLAPLSGAWPAQALPSAAVPTVSPPTVSPPAPVSLTATTLSAALASEAPNTTPSPVPTATNLPEPTPTPSPVPTPEPTPTPVPAGPAVATTTIAGPLVKNQSSCSIDTAALLAEPLSLSLDGDGAQVLIVHTHATEAYHPSDGAVYESQGDHRSTQPEYNMLRVGEALKEALEAQGLTVIHDQGLYDYPSYSGSYGRSAEAVSRHLAENPGIVLVLDLHRDALGTEELIYKTLADGLDEPMAQLMFVVGTDDNLEHPDWQENLKLALHLQQAVQTRYPSLMRPIHITSYRYNQQLSPGALILEVGTSGNSLSEALAAVERFAECIVPALTSTEHNVV